MARVLNAAMGSAPPEDYNNEDADADLMDVGILRLWRERVPEFKTQWPDMSLRYRNRERDPTTWQGVRFDGPGMGNSDDRLIKLVVVGRGEQSTLTAAALEPELGKLDALRHLELRHCALTVAPPSISKLTALTYLDLGKNRLTYVPDISELINLQVLILSDNDLMELPKLPIPPDDSDEDTALRTVEISGNPRLAQHMTPATVKYLFDHLPRSRKIRMLMAEESQVRARHAHDVESRALVGNVAKALAARGFAGGNQPGTQTLPGTTPATAPPANQNMNQNLNQNLNRGASTPMDVDAQGPSTPNRGEDGDGALRGESLLLLARNLLEGFAFLSLDLPPRTPRGLELDLLAVLDHHLGFIRRLLRRLPFPAPGLLLRLGFGPLFLLLADSLLLRRLRSPRFLLGDPSSLRLLLRRLDRRLALSLRAFSPLALASHLVGVRARYAGPVGFRGRLDVLPRVRAGMFRALPDDRHDETNHATQHVEHVHRRHAVASCVVVVGAEAVAVLAAVRGGRALRG